MKAAFDHSSGQGVGFRPISESAVWRRNGTVKGTGKQHAPTKISKCGRTGRRRLTRGDCKARS